MTPPAGLGLAFGLRTLIQVRRTGSTGFHRLGGRPGSVKWLTGVGFAVALVLGAAAPALADVVESVDALESDAAQAIGIGLAAAGIAATFAAQVAMGARWRIGVDHTDLVTEGPFALVRNPIFPAMIPPAFGLVLLAPSWVAIAGFVELLVALGLQVRVVEEPYLLRVHGDRYATYAARVGPFVPGIGRLRLPA